MYPGFDESNIHRIPVISNNQNSVFGDEPEVQYSPIVQANGDQMCLFRDGNSKWCAYFTKPALEAGWDWKQATETTYWYGQFKQFFKPQFGFLSDFVLDKFLTAQANFQIPAFRAELIATLLFDRTGNVCGGVGWSIDQIKFVLYTTFMMQDCEKVVIQDICDSQSWFGDNAKWLDKCTGS